MIPTLIVAAELAPDTARWWWVALGAGLVVAVVLVVLLQLLLSRVREVEDGVARVWRSGGHVARNTASAWMMEQTASALEQLETEAGHHDGLLREGGR